MVGPCTSKPSALKLASGGSTRGIPAPGQGQEAYLANLSPACKGHQGLKVLLKGGVAVPSAEEVSPSSARCRTGTWWLRWANASACGAPDWFAAAPERLRKVLWRWWLRIVSPGSKLATHRMLSDDGRALAGAGAGPGEIEPEELYRALDWLHGPASASNVARHASTAGSTLVLYDLTSTAHRPLLPARRAGIRATASAMTRRSSSV